MPQVWSYVELPSRNVYKWSLYLRTLWRYTNAVIIIIIIVINRCEIWPQFSIPLAFEPPAFPNGARYSKSETNSVSVDGGTMFLLSFVKFGLRTPENLPEIPPPLKIGTAKMCLIVINSAAGCSISLAFGTAFEHVTRDLLQTFKIKGSQREVTMVKIR